MGYKALITGASGGIGAAIAARLAEDGYDVIIGYNTNAADAAALCDTLASKGHTACAVQIDMTDEKSIIRAADSIPDGPDVLVNCAGIADIRQIQDCSAEIIDRLLSVDLRGPILMCREAARQMIKKKSGCIVNISSMWGVTGASCESIYSAAKAGIIAFSRSLAMELGPSGIRVNCVAPGVIDTRMNSHLSKDDMDTLAYDTPLGRIGKPEDIADAVSFLCSNTFTTGQCIVVDGGFTL